MKWGLSAESGCLLNINSFIHIFSNVVWYLFFIIIERHQFKFKVVLFQTLNDKGLISVLSGHDPVLTTKGNINVSLWLNLSFLTFNCALP